MAGEIAQAFVRIRPDLSGFKGEVTTGVKGAFSGIGKIVGVSLAVGGLTDFTKSLVEAATQNQAAFDVLRGSIKNVGAQAKIFGGEIEDVIAKEARLKGFQDDELAQAMVRLVSATGDTKKAFHDLVLAEDLARARHIDVATAALALSKAEQGNFTSLQRYGIVVKSSATETLKLKEAHDKAVASGATFTAAQKQAYQASLAAAGAADKQAKAEAAIQLVEARFGGAGSTFAKTAAGQFARLREDIHQFEESLGNVLLPTLAGGAEGLGKFITGVTQSGDAARALTAAGAPLKEGLHDVGEIAKVIAPPLLAVAHAAAAVTGAIGAGPILAGVVAFKGYGAALSIASRAQAEYSKAVAAGVAAEEAFVVTADGAVVHTNRGTIAAAANAKAVKGQAVAQSQAAITARSLAVALGAETASVATNTAAQTTNATHTLRSVSTTNANTRATAANTAATAEDAAATSALAFTKSGLLLPLNATTAAYFENAAAAQAAAIAETEQVTASSAAATRLGRLGQAGKGLFGAASGAAGGPLALGIVALAGGIAYLATRETEWESANKHLTSSTNNLVEALNRQRDAIGKVGKAAAAQDVQVRTAEEAASVARIAGDALKFENTEANNLRRGIQLKWTEEQKAARVTQVHTIAVNDFVHKIGEQIVGLGKNQPLLAHNLELIGELAKQTSAIPSKASIELLINNKNPKAGLTEILSPLAQLVKYFKDLSDSITGVKMASSGTWPGVLKAIQTAAAAGAAQERQKDRLVASLQGQLASLTAAGDEALAIQRQDLAQQEAQGREQVKQAIASAQQNFASIGQSIASSVGQVIDKPFQTAVAAIGLAQDRIAAKYDRLTAELIPEERRLAAESARAQLASDRLNLKRLGQTVLLPGGKRLDADPQKALGELKKLAASSGVISKSTIEEFILQYSSAFRAVEGDQLSLKRTAIDNGRSARETALQLRQDDLKLSTDHADLLKQSVTRRINDLIVAATSGKAKFSTVVSEIDKILERNGATVKDATALLGPAFGAQFQAQLTGLDLQGDAIKAGPKRPGLGLLPTIVKPEQVLKQTLLANHRAEIALSKAEFDQSKKQTALLTKIHNAQKGTRFTDSITKNPGQQSKVNNALTGTKGS